MLSKGGNEHMRTLNNTEWGGGGGGPGSHAYTFTHQNTSVYTCTYTINAVYFYYLWYGTINDKIPPTKQ